MESKNLTIVTVDGRVDGLVGYDDDDDDDEVDEA